MVRNREIETIRKDTSADLRNKLSEYNKCCLIRPTGFGKTWTLTGMIRDYKRVLYVYPSAAILNTVVDVYFSDENTLSDPDTIELAKEMRQFDHVDMMTYMKLQGLSKKDIDNMPEYDLIIFDEAHIMGAKKAKLAIKKMFDRFSKGTHFIGATATPNRMDGFDIVGEFFDNVVVFPYTLHDAFQDNLLQKPAYCFCPWDSESVKKNAIASARDQLFVAGVDPAVAKRRDLQDLIKTSIIQEANILDMDKNIRRECDKYLEGTYMKFICFFCDIRKIDEKGKEVKEWFQKAYPDRTVKTYDIHSRKNEDAIDDIFNLKEKDNHIDLIFCVNMINVGYHVNDLSGILMYRGTQSNIIYIQQLGRALSSGSDKPCVVFDVVDNIHRKAIYQMKTKRVHTSRRVQPTPNVLARLSQSQLEKYNTRELRCRIEDWSDKGYGHEGLAVLANDEHVNSQTGDIEISWWHETNKVEKEDLIASMYEATYKELIAKAVAEPISHLCREAVNLHFKRWCRDRGVKYPVTTKELKEMYGIPENEWREDFKKILESSGLDYPWQDAEKIMTCAAVPLEVFAREKQVSVPRILELLGVA